MKLYLTALVLLSVLDGHGQMINNAALYRNLPAVRSLKIHYENDFFSGSDRYYTQGINFEIIHPGLKNSPFKKLLPAFKNAEDKVGVAVEHLGFTPTTISSNEISYGDRPFASTLMLKSFRVSNDSTRRQRISSSMTLGVIGPLAVGAEFQKSIHRWMNGTPPQGWRNQVSNDAVINYSVEFAKAILTRKGFALATTTELRLGTLHSRAQTGIVMMLGIFEHPWNSFTVSKRKFQLYIYDQPQVLAIGYDATLQGGFFNRDSPNVISRQDVERLVFQNNAGLIISFRKLHLEYFQSFLSKEFSKGKSHFYGGLRIGLIL